MGTLEFRFNNGAISENNWKAIKSYIEDNDVKSVLEIGTGYSTVLMAELGVIIKSYDTSTPWINLVMEHLNGKYPVDLISYQYPEFPNCSCSFDMAFVDGPGQHNNNGRKDSMVFVRDKTNSIFVHDSMRPNESKAISEVFADDDWSVEYIGDGLSLLTRKG